MRVLRWNAKWPSGVRTSRAALAILTGLAACATPESPYRPADAYQVERQFVIDAAEPQLEVGRPVAVLDGVNHYVFSLPTKLILWNWRALDHRLPQDEGALLMSYVRANGLRSVKIRHNQYAPLKEFGRLRRNKNVGGGYRYTFGMLNWRLPFIGLGDHFNPYSNTINVYSSDSTILLHEGGHAKDYIEHSSRGTTFALPRMLPGVDLLQEATASSDAIHYLQCEEERETELRAYRTLYPAYSTYIAGYGGLWALAPVVVTGHIVGRAKASMRSSEIAEEEFLSALHEPPDPVLPRVCWGEYSLPLRDTYVNTEP
jgi:hypothetical protein